MVQSIFVKRKLALGFRSGASRGQKSAYAEMVGSFMLKAPFQYTLSKMQIFIHYKVRERLHYEKRLWILEATLVGFTLALSSMS